MQKTTLLAATMIVSAVPCFAQTIVNVGFMFNTSVGATSRGGTAGTSHIEILARYDFDDYRAYGIAQPSGGAQIMGLQSIIQDQEGTTPENFNVFIYAQDPANNDFPNYVAGTTPGLAALGSVLNVAGPTFNAGPTAGLYTFNFATPVLVPNDVGDVFASFELPANAGWPTTDGLSVQIILANAMAAPFTTWDLPGAAPISQNSYGGTHDVTNSAFAYSSRRQIWCDLRSNGANAVGTAITNQTAYTISNVAPGTSGFLSACHPDAASPPANSGRVDDINYSVFPDNLAVGSLVFKLGAFSFQNPQLPLSAFLPGSTGVLCVPPTATNLGFQIEAGVRLDYTILIPAAVRPTLAGAQFVFSAIALDPASLTLTGLPCVRQAF